MKKYKVNEMVFETIEKAYEYCVEQNISPEDLETLYEEEKEELKGEETVDDSEEPEENLDETTAEEAEPEGITLDEARRNVVARYSELTESEKKLVLSKLAGEYTGKPKGFGEKVSTEDIEKRGAYVQYMLKKVERGECPCCPKHWSQLSTAQALNAKTAKELKSSLIELHMLSEHKETYQILQEFTHSREAGDTELPSGQLMPNQTGAPNPEQCSDPEKLTKEELAQELSKDPDMLKRFYKRAFDKMSGRTE